MPDEHFPVEFRFYAELGDFLPPAWRGRDFEHLVAPHQSVKHVIEALGVPHGEVGLLLINGAMAAMDCRLMVNDRVTVLPVLRHLMKPDAGPAPSDETGCRSGASFYRRCASWTSGALSALCRIRYPVAKHVE